MTRTHYATREEAVAVFKEVTGMEIPDEAEFRIDNENPEVVAFIGVFPGSDAPDVIIWLDEEDADVCQIMKEKTKPPDNW